MPSMHLFAHEKQSAILRRRFGAVLRKALSCCVSYDDYEDLNEKARPVIQIGHPTDFRANEVKIPGLERFRDDGNGNIMLSSAEKLWAMTNLAQHKTMVSATESSRQNDKMTPSALNCNPLRMHATNGHPNFPWTNSEYQRIPGSSATNSTSSLSMLKDPSTVTEESVSVSAKDESTPPSAPPPSSSPQQPMSAPALKSQQQPPPTQQNKQSTTSEQTSSQKLPSTKFSQPTQRQYRDAPPTTASVPTFRYSKDMSAPRPRPRLILKDDAWEKDDVLAKVLDAGHS